MAIRDTKTKPEESMVEEEAGVEDIGEKGGEAQIEEDDLVGETGGQTPQDPSKDESMS